jgi:hypothetical protein
MERFLAKLQEQVELGNEYGFKELYLNIAMEEARSLLELIRLHNYHPKEITHQ